MGYYPTPEPVVDRVRSFLYFPDEPVNVLDPCCGEGAAVASLIRGTNARTYGIEPDDYRADRARRALDHVLHCGYEDARASRGAFSLLFLNPPYDWVHDEDDRHERTERAFLRGTERYVGPDGVLVYVVPQARVTPDVAKLLSFRFRDLDAYRFTDPEYERFGQIVLFGAKKPEPEKDAEARDYVGEIPYLDLPVIPYAEQARYDVPPFPEPALFRSTRIDPAELERELQNSRLWRELEDNHGNGPARGRPPLPLHTGHLGLLLASGCLDGVIGEGDDRHVVRGKVEKVTNVEQEYQGDVLVERETERYRVSVKVLTADGEIRNLT